MTDRDLDAPVKGDDLFELANAICACIDAPVTIEDRHSRVLAFSARQAEADAMRIATVLSLQVPPDHVAGTEQRAAIRQVSKSRHACFFDAASLGGGHVTLGRTAVAVRAGDVLLGFIWAAVKEPLSPALEEWLLGAADVVAFHLQRSLSESDTERRRLGELVDAALAGGHSAREALDALGLPDGPTLVLAMDVRAAQQPDDQEQRAALLAEQERLRNALAVHLTVTSSKSVVVDQGGLTLALVPVPDRSGADLVQRACEDFRSRADRSSLAAIGISNVARTPTDLVRARSEAVRSLRVIRSAPVDHPSAVARTSDVEVESLILELHHVCEIHGIQPNGAFARLRAYDERKRTNLLETVRYWLDTHGDTVAAAEALHVHPNTFRYRLRRAGEVGAVDLNDPQERFALNLQLRLFGQVSQGAR